jgi:hypothetical protein
MSMSYLDDVPISIYWVQSWFQHQVLGCETTVFWACLSQPHTSLHGGFNEVSTMFHSTAIFWGSSFSLEFPTVTDQLRQLQSTAIAARPGSAYRLPGEVQPFFEC